MMLYEYEYWQIKRNLAPHIENFEKLKSGYSIKPKIKGDNISMKPYLIYDVQFDGFIIQDDDGYFFKATDPRQWDFDTLKNVCNKEIH